MNGSGLPAVAVAALLVLSGCTGLGGSDGGGPSADEFPEATEIDASVFERHATALSNTSFTVEFASTDNRTDPRTGELEYRNSSSRWFVEPEAPQLLSRSENPPWALGSLDEYRVYSEGDGAYTWARTGDDTPTRRLDRYPLFDASREDASLWGQWFDDYPSQQLLANVTVERVGTETFRGTTVMRYEASGVAAIDESAPVRQNENYTVTAFSMTILLDADGVVRHYRDEYDVRIGDRTHNTTRAHTVTDVGSTDVERPAWVANATSGD